MKIDKSAYGEDYNKERNDKIVKIARLFNNEFTKYTYTTERYFEPFQYIKGDGTPLRIGSESLITALMIISDTEVKPQDSVYGKTEFMQLVGITASEMQAILDDRNNVHKLIELMKADGNEDLVTDMNRTKSYL